MSKRALLSLFAPLLAVSLLAGAAQAQYTPWHYWTLLDADVMDEIIGETSGETAWSPEVPAPLGSATADEGSRRGQDLRPDLVELALSEQACGRAVVELGIQTLEPRAR